MAIQYSATVANARLDAVESAIGAAAVLKFRTGAPPASITNSDSGSVVATLVLPSDWMAPAASRAKAKSGTWEDTSADASGTIGHFRLYASDGTTQHFQGTVTNTGGGGDLEVDNVAVNAEQAVTITGFTLSE